MHIGTETMKSDEAKPRLQDQWVKKLIDYFANQDYLLLEEPTLREFKNKGWHKPDLLVFKRSVKTLRFARARVFLN